MRDGSHADAPVLPGLAVVLRYLDGGAVRGVDRVRVVGVGPLVRGAREARIGDEIPLVLRDRDRRDVRQRRINVEPAGAGVIRFEQGRGGSASQQQSGGIDLIQDKGNDGTLDGSRHRGPRRAAIEGRAQDGIGPELLFDGVDDVGVARIDVHLPAALLRGRVVGIDHGPGLEVGIAGPLDAVGLDAGEQDSRGSRVRGDAVDLRDRQVAVQVGPGIGIPHGGQLPDAAVAAEEEVAEPVLGDDVLRRVRAVAVHIDRQGNPAGPTGGGLEDLPGLRGRVAGVAADHDGGGVDQEDRVVVAALAAEVIRRLGRRLGPHAAARGADEDALEFTVLVRDRGVNGNGVLEKARIDRHDLDVAVQFRRLRNGEFVR